MKKVILLCGMLLALSATVASAAQGVNLRWNACAGDAPLAQINRAFACGSNGGGAQIFGSFQLTADLARVSGNEIIVDLASETPILPAWWQFINAGTCRQGSLQFFAGNAPLSAINCVGWGNVAPSGGIGAYQIGVGGPNTARIVAAAAVSPTALSNLFAGQEYYSFILQIDNAKTTGLGSCGGCSTPVCIVLNSLNLTTPIAANNRLLSGPANGTDSNFCTWQGGGNPSSGRGNGCPAATPTRSSTWGTVKSLYR